MTTLERLRTTLAALSLTAVDARLETLLEGAPKPTRDGSAISRRGCNWPTCRI
jgi:hypothetical protein